MRDIFDTASEQDFENAYVIRIEPGSLGTEAMHDIVRETQAELHPNISSRILDGEVQLAFHSDGESPSFMRSLELAIYDWVRGNDPKTVSMDNRQISQAIAWDYSRGQETSASPQTLDDALKETVSPDLFNHPQAQICHLDSGLIAPDTLLGVVQKVESDPDADDVSYTLDDDGIRFAFGPHVNPANFMRKVGFEIAEQAREIDPSRNSQLMEKILSDFEIERFTYLTPDAPDGQNLEPG